MKKNIALALLFLTLPYSAGAVGIAMRFVDVSLENVEPGAVFNLRVLKNLPLVVVNLDENEGTDCAVETSLPSKSELKEGYEAIPDPSWVSVVPNRFHLGPKASASGDLIVKIPNDPKLIGHHYEVIVWAHNDMKNKLLPEGGVIIQTGIRTRFRLSIGTKGPASLQREKMLKKLATINTNFTINPDNLYVQNVPVGKSVDLKAEMKASLKIINQADDPVDLRFHSVSADPNINPQAGYVFAPDPSWLEVIPDEMKVPGNSIKEIKLRVKIPEKPEFHDKKYLFLIKATLADDSLPLAYTNMVYVTTGL